jgi:hypothetical protein
MKYFALVNGNQVLNTVVADEKPNAIDMGQFIEYSMDGSIGHNVPQIGATYDFENEAFINPKPYESWVFNEQIFKWEAPSIKPATGYYRWEEAQLSWIEMVN